MDYHKIRTSGNLDDRSLCILDEPEGLQGKDYYLRHGRRIGKDLSQNMKYYMDEEYPGTKLCPLISNLSSFLIVSSEIVAMIQQVCDNEIEYLPFTLYDHEKRVASEDYFIVNPIGTFDCLNEGASEIEYTRHGSPMEPYDTGYILDPDKLKGSSFLSD